MESHPHSEIKLLQDGPARDGLSRAYVLLLKASRKDWQVPFTEVVYFIKKAHSLPALNLLCIKVFPPSGWGSP
jgi:hypothetical protein